MTKLMKSVFKIVSRKRAIVIGGSVLLTLTFNLDPATAQGIVLAILEAI